jgi:hypothetical protein
MNIIAKRMIAVLATLMLAGATLGCDREVGDEEVTMGEPGAVDQEAEGIEQMGQEGQMGEMGEMEQQDQPDPMAQPDQMVEQDQEVIQEVRDEVADELGIPASAVVIDSQMSQDIPQLTSEVQRRGWVTVSTIEDYLTRLNMDTLEQEQRQAATELQQQVPRAEQTLQQMQQATEEQAQEMESDLEEQLSQIGDNWDEISDELDFEQQPAGGGPIDQQEGMDEQPQQNY